MKVLIVDDEMMIREWLEMSCREYGLSPEDIIHADNGSFALEKLEEGGIDLVFTDITMPRMDGIELIRHIRAKKIETNIVILTCHADFDYAREAVKYGVSSYLLKSELSKKDIIQTLEHFGSLSTRKKKNVINLNSDARSFLLSTEQDYLDREILASYGIRLDDRRIVVASLVSEPEALSFFETEAMSGLLDNIHLFSAGVGFVVICANVASDELVHSILKKKLSEIAATKGIRAEQLIVGCPFKDVGELKKEVRKAVRAQHIWYFGISDDKLVKPDDRVLFRISEQKGFLLASISERNGEGVRNNLALLFEHITKEGLYEMFFIKRMLCEISESLIYSFNLKTIVVNEFLNCINFVWNFNESKKQITSITETIGRDGSSDSDNIHKALDYISQNYYRQITLSDIAEHVCLSEEYFSRLFKKETGRTFINYLNEVRMKKANQLLLRNKHSINEICEMVGIQSPSYFSTLFKKYYNTSPREVKNKEDL